MRNLALVFGPGYIVKGEDIAGRLCLVTHDVCDPVASKNKP